MILSLVTLAACSSEPSKTVDISSAAANRAKANIDTYAAGRAPVTPVGASPRAR